MYLKDFNETFSDELRDPEFVETFLEASLEEGVETFLVALKEVAKANGGMSALSRTTALGRENLYKALSERGNPEFKTVQSVLNALGMRFSITRADVKAA
jgi:probable addiction module antidote protein